ncbi:hypothetical protein FIBSPDRAFT_875837 [Athelia psychrophila]|uniref:Uncharacterized protein n=1 Tax=Athelia psychrophila TaxID=1759441 RepID=A0A167XFT7_9AGAM|nr:hypothetical protein FIBSPDRAFT_875837 [Fibularhizoctonia sp. CBS 109695]
MHIVEYSLTSFLASIPSMRAFLRLSLLYKTWQREVESRGREGEVLRVKWGRLV